MKNLLLVLLVIVGFLSACSGFSANKNKNNGGILIVYGGTTSTTTVVLLEKNLKITPSKTGYTQIKPLEEGYYSLLIKGPSTRKGEKDRVVKNIKVIADSLSIFPLRYFETVDFKDSIVQWGSKKHWHIKRKTTQLNGLPGPQITKTLKDGTTVVDSSFFFFPPLQKRIKMCDTLPAVNLSGRVDLEGYKPCKNCDVFLSYWWYAKTDENGFYHFKNVLPGIYQLGGYVRMRGDYAYMPYLEEVNLIKDTTYTINFNLTNASSIRELE